MITPALIAPAEEPVLAPEKTAEVADSAKLAFFEAKIRPLLIEHCYDCHSADSGESCGGLFLDHRDALLRGGLTGRAVVPGKPSESLLMRVVQYDDPDMQMPPEGKLSDDQIADLRKWIASGAIDPRMPPHDAGAQEPISPLERDPQSHWAFVPPRRSIPPDHSGASDGSDLDPIDAWVAKVARERKLKLAPLADDETIVRRLHFDLTGIMPTYQTIQAYLRDTSPDRYSRLVDRLLASPEYSERMTRRWMDVARYADTLGYATAGKERKIPGSHRYRDWLIGVFADDMPYDEMIVHQLAADSSDPDNASGNADAMGFLTLGRRFLNDLDITDDRIDVIGRGLQGLTVSCARCHDHKFDPIPTSDYYSLFGVLRSSRLSDDPGRPLMMVDRDKPRDHAILVRGQRGNRGEKAPRQFLTALRKPNEDRFREGSGRRELAQRIASADNPLTSRVMVNRVWKWLIGKALVRTPSDFGFRTPPPAIPEVLEDLATDFASDFRIKRLVRRIVHTRVYRSSTKSDPQTLQSDPDNQYLTRANRKRRDFESLRDSMLVVADHLNRQMGGPSVDITSGQPTPRRSLYAMIDRQNLPPLFRTFDFASPDTHSPGRYETTVPQQGLYLMNSPALQALAESVADAVRSDAPETAADQVRALFRRVLARDPSAGEMQMTGAFLDTPLEPFEAPVDPKTLWSYGLMDLPAKANERPRDFRKFPHFAEGRYRGAGEYPAPKPLGFAFLDAGSGHTAGDPKLGVVRRLTMPFDGVANIRGQLGHRSMRGDGVRMSIWAGSKRIMKLTAKANNRPEGPHRVALKKGQVIDFVASAGKDASFDSFFWRITVSLRADDGRTVNAMSQSDFAGPAASDKTPDEAADRLTQAAQVLLISNEFSFVD